MKSDLIKLIEKAIPISRKVAFEVSRTKSEKHGHWTSNVAMILAKEVKKNPREIALQIISDMPKHKMVEKIEVAGPGFINFFLTEDAYLQFTKELLKKKDGYFPYKEKKPKKILIEYVSANPTGPLHIGHGRGAAFGSALSNLLIKAGNKVTQEYYVNDAGNQIKALIDSVWLRYLQILGVNFEFPKSEDSANSSFYYQGDYIKDIAKEILKKHKKVFISKENLKSLKSKKIEFAPSGTLKANEIYVENLPVMRMTDSSIANKYLYLFENSVLEISLDKITKSLSNFGVYHDQLVYESYNTLNHYNVPKNLKKIKAGNKFIGDLKKINKVVEIVFRLKELGLLYIKDKAIWFNSSKFGDDKDRVLCKKALNKAFIYRDGTVNPIEESISQFSGKIYHISEITSEDLYETGSMSHGGNLEEVSQADYEINYADLINDDRRVEEGDEVIWDTPFQWDLTYFVPDIAYHESKFQRGYDQMLNIFGADHHGYLPRLKGALSGLGYDVDKLKTVFLQFANLFKDGEKTSMSTRAGEFVDLDKLIEEVGVDATRFFFLAKKGDQTLDFDLDLAVSEDKNNPVYYIQYAYARICSLEAELKKRKLNFDLKEGIKKLKILNGKTELEIIKMIDKYPDLIEQCVKDLEIHPICFYLRDLAAKFHSFYNAETIIEEDVYRTNAKFALLLAIKKIISGGMEILSVSTPEKM